MIDLQDVTVLIFDFGGVLINLKRDNAVRKLSDLGVKDAEMMLNNYVQSGIFLNLEKGLLSAEEFRNEIRVMNGIESTDEQIDEAWKAFLLDIPDEKLNLLLELRKKYRVIMLSNTNEIHFEYCKAQHFTKQGLTLDDYFDKCYLSYKMKMAKPEESIFRQLLKEEGIDAAHCMFIDDGAVNIEVAKSLGFKTYLAKEREDFSGLF